MKIHFYWHFYFSGKFSKKNFFCFIFFKILLQKTTTKISINFFFVFPMLPMLKPFIFSSYCLIILAVKNRKTKKIFWIDPNHQFFLLVLRNEQEKYARCALPAKNGIISEMQTPRKKSERKERKREKIFLFSKKFSGDKKNQS